jgi:hypothetical protein
MQIVPRETWESLFKSQDMKNPTPRIKMLDGFNEGWIEFESAEAWLSKRKSRAGSRCAVVHREEQDDPGSERD